jgi:hypothetical protein
MRVRSPLVLGFCGLALSVSAAPSASAQDGPPYGPEPVGVSPSTGAMPPAMGAPTPAPANAQVQPAPAHHHHGLLGRRHCVECQRAYAKKHDGVDVPPPPGYPGGPPPAAGGTIVSGPVVVSEHVVGAGDPHAPGYAVVGGAESGPGYAVVNGGEAGAEPTPVGVARGAQYAMADPGMAGPMPRPGAGSYDPAVMPTSVPPPPSPMSGPGHNRPHIISHTLGLPILGKRHEQRVERRREQHAAIAYGDPNKKVTELPASVVYSQK